MRHGIGYTADLAGRIEKTWQDGLHPGHPLGYTATDV